MQWTGMLRWCPELEIGREWRCLEKPRTISLKLYKRRRRKGARGRRRRDLYVCHLGCSTIEEEEEEEGGEEEEEEEDDDKEEDDEEDEEEEEEK